MGMARRRWLPCACTIAVFIAYAIGSVESKNLAQLLDENYAIVDVTNRWISLAKAIECFQKAAEVDGDYTYEANFKLGQLFSAIGRIDEGLESYSAATAGAAHLTDKASSATAHATLLSAMGRGEEAVKLLQMALKYNNMNLNQYLPYVLVHRELDHMQRKDWKDLIHNIESAIEQQVRRKGILGDSEQGYSSSNSVGRDVYWALFEAYDKIGEFGKAWINLEKAQKYVADFQARNAKGVTRTTRGAISSEDVLVHHILSKSLKKSKKNANSTHGSTSIDPVFLVGMPRSGVDAFGIMLCSHTDVFCDTEESLFSGLEAMTLKSDITKAFLTSVEGMSSSAAVHSILNKFRAAFFNRSYGQLGGAPYQQYRKIFVDTAVENYQNIHLIKQTFPNSLIIHVVRDPMDSLMASYRYRYHNIDKEWAVGGSDLLDEYIGYLKAMNYYRNLYADSILEVSFEAISQDTERTVRIVLEYMGATWETDMGMYNVPYDSSMLYSFSTKNIVTVKSEFDRHSIGAWRNYMEETANIREHILKKLSILDGSKAIVSFASSMNWAISKDFNYTSFPEPGVLLPFKRKISRKMSASKKKRKKGDHATMAGEDEARPAGSRSSPAEDILSQNSFPPQGQAASMVQEPVIESMHASKKHFRWAALSLSAEDIVFTESLFSDLIFRLKTPLLTNPASSQLKTSKGKKNHTLPVSKRRKRIMSLHNRTVLYGPHSISVLNNMKSLLGYKVYGSPNSSNSHQGFDDIVATGFCYLASNLQNQNENAMYVFQEALTLLSKEKADVSVLQCHAGAGMKVAMLQKMNYNLLVMQMLTSPQLWLPVIDLTDLAGVVNFFISRHELRAALNLITDVLSREYYGKVPSRLLLIQAAIISLRLGKSENALVYINKVDKISASSLPVIVLKTEIIASQGEPKKALTFLVDSMSKKNATSGGDKYVEENTRIIDIKRLRLAIDNMDALFTLLSNDAISTLRRACNHSALQLEPMITLGETLNHLRQVAARAGLVQREHMHLLSLIDSSTDLSTKVFASMAVFHMAEGDIFKASDFVSRILEKHPDVDYLLLIKARLEIMGLGFTASLNIFDHVLLLPGRDYYKMAWIHREMFYYWCVSFEKPLTQFNIHHEISPMLRREFSASPLMDTPEDGELVSEWNISALRVLQKLSFHKETAEQIAQDIETNGKYLNSSLIFSKGIPGLAFFSTFTSRQLAAMGMGAGRIGGMLRRHIESLKGKGEHVMISNAGAFLLDGAMDQLSDPQSTRGLHQLVFSDLLDVALKLVQLVDILRPAIYLQYEDCLFSRDFAVSNSCFDGNYKALAFARFRDMVRSNFEDKLSHSLTDSQKRDHLGLINSVSDINTLCAIAGVDCALSFEIVVLSLARQKTELPGIELYVGGGDGAMRVCYRFPCSRVRLAHYVTEFDFIFDRIIAAVTNLVHPDEMLSLSLDLYFYWMNLSPLRAGNSEVGYVLLTGILSASKVVLEPNKIKTGAERNPQVQLEWLAILSENTTQFRNAVVDEFALRPAAAAEVEFLNIEATAMSTPLDILKTLQLIH